MEVIVVGAGVIGCAVAYELARHDVSVHVIEARRPGQGATQASAGVLAPYIEGHDSDLLRDMGRRSLDLFDGLVGRLTLEARADIPYERTGTIEVALGEGEAERLRTSLAALTAGGVDASWLSPSEVSVLEPSATSRCDGALFVPMHGFIAAQAFTRGLASAAAHHGTRFDDAASATAIEPARGGRVAVTTSRGVMHADRVVLAAGSWSSHLRLAGVEHVPVRPVRGQLLHLSWPAPRLTRVIWGSACYIVPWPDGTVLVGATVEDVGFDETATVDGVRGLLEAACTLVPALSSASFHGVRVGLRPAGPDALPLIGPSRRLPGLLYATGHYRNGVLLAPLTAHLTRTLVLDEGKDAALDATSPGRAGPL